MQFSTTVLISDEFEFRGQTVQAAAPAAEYVPAPHFKQVLISTASTVPEYLPAPQFKHILDAVVEYLPAPQAVQAALPAAALKVPATQGRHGPLLAPVYPALHKQLL